MNDNVVKFIFESCKVSAKIGIRGFIHLNLYIFLGMEQNGNLLNILVPLSEDLREKLFATDLSKYKILLCDTTKKFLHKNYVNWCNKRNVEYYAYSSFYKKTKFWVKTGKYRDGVCIHCHLYEKIANKIQQKGFNSLTREEIESHRLYEIHKVLLILNIIFLFREVQIVFAFF